MIFCSPEWKIGAIPKRYRADKKLSFRHSRNERQLIGTPGAAWVLACRLYCLVIRSGIGSTSTLPGNAPGNIFSCAKWYQRVVSIRQFRRNRRSRSRQRNLLAIARQAIKIRAKKTRKTL